MWCPALNKRDCLSELSSHIASQAYHIHLEELEPEVRLACEVKHFVYKSDLHSQLVMCLPQQPYAHSKQHRKWLFRRYQHVLARIGATTGEIGDSSSADAGAAAAKIGAQALAHKKHQFYLEMSDFANLFCGQFLAPTRRAHFAPPTTMQIGVV